MTPSEGEIEYKLNMLWIKGDKDDYDKHVETLKGVGYKVFRNSKGKHKVSYNTAYFSEVFGGILGKSV